VTPTIEIPETTDAEAIVDLWVDLAAEQHQYGSHLVAEANREPIQTTVLTHIVAEEALVAREADTIVGFVTFEANTGRYEETVDRGIVHNIYVRPEARDDGLGGRLLAAAEERLAAAGVDVVSLEVMAENEDALRFYRRTGYASHRVTVEKPLDTTDD
jgi:ribosomal protein S18 acetylase RimI-like enzyme